MQNNVGVLIKMDILNIISLAIVQGLTEFLPVSSSGHLVVFSKFMGFVDQGIGIDIALHIGSLLAVLIYFKNDVAGMVREVFKAKFTVNVKEKNSRLAWMIAAASVPALICGFWLRHYHAAFFRNPNVIGFNILFYGLILYAADVFSKKEKTLETMNFADAVCIGLAQCLALVPGTSRSGITITMARILKLNRVDAAKFSMLLSVPVIAGAGVLEIYRLICSGSSSDIVFALEAVCFSFAASYAVIYFMMAWVKKFSFLVFASYRVLLGLWLIFGVL